MSALAVIFNWDGSPVEPKILEAMAIQVSGLGPDGIHYLYRNNIGFAYLALNSTPESLHEKQPLESEENRYFLVADVRLDNRPELLNTLRRQLPNKEIITDPDIVLAAYRKWGDESPAHLIGDFAFVIWDNETQEIFAARDTMHARTLHYAKLGKSLCITSEAQQIIQHPLAQVTINELAVASWLIAEPRNHLSMFEEAQPIPTGHCLKWKERKISVWRYWEINPEHRIRYKNTEEYEEHLREILSRAVHDRMRSNGSIIACELSGGMDSSTVTALAQSQAPSLNKNILALSHKYTKHPACDESAYIDTITQHLELDHCYINIEQEGSLGLTTQPPCSLENPAAFWYPKIRPSIDHASQAGAQVLLTGIGGDEATWGHLSIYLHRLLRGDFRVLMEIDVLAKRNQAHYLQVLYGLLLHPLIPESVKIAKRALIKKLKPPEISTQTSWIPEETIKRLNIPDAVNPISTLHFKNKAQDEWHKCLSRAHYSTLHIYNWAGATAGVDVRHPFIDRRLLEFTFAVPVSLWQQHTYPKWLLRQSMQQLLPKTIVERGMKTDFSTYYKSELKSHRYVINKLIKSPCLQQHKLINHTSFINAFNTYLDEGDLRGTLAFCYVAATAKWCNTHFREG